MSGSEASKAAVRLARVAVELDLPADGRGMPANPTAPLERAVNDAFTRVQTSRERKRLLAQMAMVVRDFAKRLPEDERRQVLDDVDALWR